MSAAAFYRLPHIIVLGGIVLGGIVLAWEQGFDWGDILFAAAVVDIVLAAAITFGPDRLYSFPKPLARTKGRRR